MNESEAIARLERERQVFRDNIKNCRAALRMIREAVETHAPPGSVPAEEYIEPPFTAEAEHWLRGYWLSRRQGAWTEVRNKPRFLPCPSVSRSSARP